MFDFRVYEYFFKLKNTIIDYILQLIKILIKI